MACSNPHNEGVYDYLLIVQALKPVDGYYKLDVYLYYTLTFALPLIIYWWKKTLNPGLGNSRQAKPSS